MTAPPCSEEQEQEEKPAGQEKANGQDDKVNTAQSGH
jgi:hypothetical protein